MNRYGTVRDSASKVNESLDTQPLLRDILKLDLPLGRYFRM
jgi:hypothetical protein